MGISGLIMAWVNELTGYDSESACSPRVDVTDIEIPQSERSLSQVVIHSPTCSRYGSVFSE